MRTKIAPLACLVALTFAIVVPRAAFAQWPVDGAVLSDHAQYWDDDVRLFPDGAGGVLCKWLFHGGGDTHIFATRVTSVGALADNWAANGTTVAFSVVDGDAWPDGAGGLMVGASLHYGVGTGEDACVWHLLPTGSTDWNGAVAATTFDERGTQVTTDGAGGWYVAWVRDAKKLYLQHLQSNGARFSTWPAAGLVVGSSGFALYGRIALMPDGSGGVLVLFLGPDYARVQRVTASGTLWSPSGIPLGVNQSNPYGPCRIVPSGADHFIAVWQDHSSSTSTDRLVLQRVGFDGSIDGAWPPDGLVAVDGADQNGGADAITDGADGVLLAWAVGGANAHGLRYLSDGSRAAGWPASGVTLRSGLLNGWAITNGAGTSLVFAGAGHVQWLLGDGTPDPSQPADGQFVNSTNTVNTRALMPDGGGGVYVAWDRYNPTYGRQTLMLSRVTYPTPLAVGPRVDGRTLELRIVGPNPSRGDFAMSCTLAPDAPARLELLDLSGRRVRDIALEGAGTHSARFDETASLRPGLYLVRLTQAAHSRTARVAIVR